VAGELPREPHNARLHLFSAAPELVEFGRHAYRRRSEQSSRLLGQLFERLRGEGFAVWYSMEDFNRQFAKEHFKKLTPQERREAPESLPPEERLAGLSAEQIRQYLDQLTAQRSAGAQAAAQEITGMESGDIPKNKRDQNASADTTGMMACQAFNGSTARRAAELLHSPASSRVS
jgi:hypothetical protein